MLGDDDHVLLILDKEEYEDSAIDICRNQQPISTYLTSEKLIFPLSSKTNKGGKQFWMVSICDRVISFDFHTHEFKTYDIYIDRNQYRD